MGGDKPPIYLFKASLENQAPLTITF